MFAIVQTFLAAGTGAGPPLVVALAQAAVFVLCGITGLDAGLVLLNAFSLTRKHALVLALQKGGSVEIVTVPVVRAFASVALEGLLATTQTGDVFGCFGYLGTNRVFDGDGLLRAFWELAILCWITTDLGSIVAILYIHWAVGTRTFLELAVVEWVTAHIGTIGAFFGVCNAQNKYWAVLELAVVLRIATHIGSIHALFHIHGAHEWR